MAAVPAVPASAAPPQNDERVNAVPIALGPEVWYDSRDVAEATVAEDDPSCSGASTVWYQFTGNGRKVILDTAASSYGTTLALLGPDGGELACTTVGLNGSPQAWLETDTQAGLQYLVAVGSSFGEGSNMGLAVTEEQPFDPGDGGGEEPPPPPAPGPPPANDDVANALTLPGLPYRSNVIDTTGAGSDGTEPQHCSSPHNSVWFSYTPDRNRTVAFDTLGSDYDTALAVVVPNEFGWGIVGCSTDALGTVQSRAEVALTAGTTYTIVVTAQFRFREAIPGDLVLHAEEVVPLTVQGTAVTHPVAVRSGVAQLQVELSCSRPAQAGVQVELRQRAGDRVLIGHGSAHLEGCGSAKRVAVTIFPDREGGFHPGPAEVIVRSSAESLEVRATHERIQAMHLRRS